MDSFNSRTREGCDILDAWRMFATEFQFTHPRGVRSNGGAAPLPCGRFNSRTREGCDNADRSPMRCCMFQFTHPRGVRFRGNLVQIIGRVSIHAPARGAMYIHTIGESVDEFQFTHPRGVRYVALDGDFLEHVSIHAPARGAIPKWKRSRPK